ncbi:hypothetical protein ANANG_G00109380 [Anguilla anguilla]|uniref:Uncharacterized protein n=1 Tax=Anguilla anguilla TaxID=7936 RepID=A0A9D3MID1_ANGAN|nr:hypothetical protein ANANG_G00109380 [Anguilla anguilla]
MTSRLPARCLPPTGIRQSRDSGDCVRRSATRRTVSQGPCSGLGGWLGPLLRFWSDPSGRVPGTPAVRFLWLRPGQAPSWSLHLRELPGEIEFPREVPLFVGPLKLRPLLRFGTAPWCKYLTLRLASLAEGSCKRKPRTMAC